MQEHKEDKNLIEQGFTLIELLVVIAILGILAAVVVFSVNGITARGHAAACSTEVSTVQTALEAYNAQNGNYPAVAPNAGATATTLNNEIGPESGGSPNQFLDSDLTSDSPSIAAGYSYTDPGPVHGRHLPERHLTGTSIVGHTRDSRVCPRSKCCELRS